MCSSDLLPIPPGAGKVPVETAEEMLKACESELPCDIAIFAAAVADWRVDRVAAAKIKKQAGKVPNLALTENPDVLGTIAGLGGKRPRLVVGFAAETEKLIDNAREKLARKGCDLIVANDVAEAGKVFGGDRNRAHLVSAAGVESWPEMGKREVADRLMRKLAADLAAKAPKST